ncbi:MAG: Homoserine kinase [uncultured Propionibacteriaceae bacterium]|uniref:Homoserine kinase n=1 Tax=uncultured Propionibacteriaceae bacterium TaxID=257457 RepID=A0A6J4P2G6_9ACTN|nr:MAG: Homoserine kinase [uncultured Propionibacteriaceae bacterium]
MRSFVNDVYLVDSGEGRFALKIYRHGRWSVEEVCWEQDLLRSSVAAGLAVAAPVPLVDGRLAGEVTYPEGQRPYALSVWVEGTKPQPPYTDALYRDFGELIAGFHAVGDGFSSSYPRRSFELGRDFGDPLAEVLDRLHGQPAERQVVADLGVEARQHLADFGAQGADWGVCHGDVTLDNIHLTASGPVLHDFDLARPGWRLGDFTGVRATPHWKVFAAGYAQRRELDAADSALPWMQVVDLIANLRFHLVQKPMILGTESLSEGWVDRELESLRTLAGELLA